VYITLTHANLKSEEGGPLEIFVATNLIYAAYHSKAGKCTQVLSTGGAIIPVLENPQLVISEVEKQNERTMVTRRRNEAALCET
jgi:hypothetical protein